MRSLNDVSITTKLAIAFGSLAAVTVGISAIGYNRLSSIETTNRWSTHTYDVLDKLSNLTQAMVNQETGVRGYLVSADAKFLEPYKVGKIAYKDLLGQVRNLTSDNAAQQQRLTEMDRSSETWANDIAAREIALVEGGNLDKARAMEASGAGKASMDAFRAKVGELEKAERDLLVTRNEEQARSFSTAYTSSIVGSIASVAIAGLLAFLSTPC